MNPGDLFRIDDRLIHGQVMVGWVLALGLKELVLVNDRVASDSWQKEAFTAAVKAFSEDTTVCIVSKREAFNLLECQLSSSSCLPPSSFPSFFKSSFQHLVKSKRRMVIVESLDDAVELIRLGLKIPAINLGGIHMRSGREMILSYLYLDSQEMRAILELSIEGIKIFAKDLPESKEIDVVTIIKQKKV